MRKASILLLVLLLSACGAPDAMTSQGASGDTATAMPALVPSPVISTISHDIAKLLRKRPTPGEQVELDVYNWVGSYREASYDWDSQRCPDLATESLLTDQPVAGFTNYMNSGETKNGQVFTGESLIENVDAYTQSCTVVLTQADTTYELQVSFPVGLHADRELLQAFTALVAGFEVDQ